jgi:hypothetical protein
MFRCSSVKFLSLGLGRIQEIFLLRLAAIFIFSQRVESLILSPSYLASFFATNTTHNNFLMRLEIVTIYSLPSLLLLASIFTF